MKGIKKSTTKGRTDQRGRCENVIILLYCHSFQDDGIPLQLLFSDAPWQGSISIKTLDSRWTLF